MINPIELKSDLIAILNDLLGEYTFPDGGTDAAICCVPDPDVGWNYPPQGTKVTGLEVAIKNPYPDHKSLIGGDRLQSYEWEIHLKQWDTNASLQEAISRLKNLPSQYLIERTSAMPANNQLLTVEQYKVFLKEWEISVNN